MNRLKGTIRIALALTLGYLCLRPLPPAAAADPNSSLPAVIDNGLAVWAKRGGSGVDLALDAWQKGGLLEGDNKVRVLSNYFRQLDRAVGNYRATELLETRRIGRSSQVVYLMMNFERGAVYGRFLLYHTNDEWVVQNLDFSTKPEAMMPWLAFEGAKYTE